MPCAWRKEPRCPAEASFDAGYTIQSPLPTIDLALKPDTVRVALCTDGLPPRCQWPEQSVPTARVMDR